MMDPGLENGIGYHSGLWHPTPVSSVYGNHSKSSVLSSLWKSEILGLLKEKGTRKLIFLLIFCATCYCVLLVWSSSTQSMSLLAYSYTVGFNLLSLLICVLSLWVEHQPPTPLFTFGYDRFEVLAVFGSTVLAQLASLFIIKESIERLVVEQPEVHIGRLLLGAGVAFTSHLVVLYGCSHTALDHVAAASSSSWLQEHVSDISQSVCSVMPALGGLLLPRVNPMLLVACTGGFSLVLADILIEFKGCYVVDTLAGIWIALTMWATMLPMSVYSGKVLMQTTPSHLVGQLDKCLRETLTIDGVLEFRNEHFWTLSFGKMAGSLQVRVRRDANEQMVLAHVVDRLSSIVSELTVQVFKDDWALRRGVGSMGSGVGIPTSSFPVIPNDIAFGNNHSPSKTGYRSFSTSVSPATSLGDAHPSLSSGSFQSKTDLSVPMSSNSYLSLPYSRTVPGVSGLGNSLSMSSHALNTEAVSHSHSQPSKYPSMTDVTFLPTQRFDVSTGRRKKESPCPDKEHVNNFQNYPFSPNCSVSPKTAMHQPHEENLLISGVTSFDAESLTYRPR
ncbi:Zinc transporter 6 [Gryllus bimaculatus]|nr:Zinc transporter 6 [Gryllus bimaculatus]